MILTAFSCTGTSSKTLNPEKIRFSDVFRDYQKVTTSNKWVNIASHCEKSVLIRSYSGLRFPAFGLNKERYPVSLRIQSEYQKMWTRITPNTGIFCAVSLRPRCCKLRSKNCINSNTMGATTSILMLFNLQLALSDCTD